MPPTAEEQPDNYWFARHSKSIIFLISLLTIVGLYEALSIPVAVFPTTNFPRIIIGVDNGVMPIEQMEVSITRRIEEAIRAVPGLEDVRSVTSRGSAEVNLFFNWNVNMLETLQLVDAAVSRVQSTLPPTTQIQTHRLDFSSFPIIGYSLTSDTVPQTDLWEIATYDIKPRLNRLIGVASVLVQGGQQPEFHVTVDPARMLRTRVSIADITAAINRTNVIDSPGLINRNHQLFLGLVTAQAHSAEDIGNVVIKSVNNVPVRVQDIGTVARAVEPVYTAVSANGKPAVLLSVNRQPESNTVQVADEVHQEMASIRTDLARGRGNASVLRPVQHRDRIDCQRAGRDHHRALSRGAHHLAVPQGLGHGRDDRSRRAGHDGDDLHRDEGPRPDIQPDDARRAGGGGRARHRRQDRGGRKHRPAP